MEMSHPAHQFFSKTLINEDENNDSNLCECHDCLDCLINYYYELTLNEEYEVGGLIFPSKNQYEFFKKLDEKIVHIVKKLNKEEDGIKRLEEFYNKIGIMDVKETYEGATEETDGLFPNATGLLCFESSPRLALDYKAACLFFEKFNYNRETDSDSDN